MAVIVSAAREHPIQATRPLSKVAANDAVASGDERRPESDDPERLRSPLWARFFTAAMQRRMARDFSAVRLARASAPMARERLAGRAVVLYSNHPSWWDAAFLAVLAARLFPRRRAFAPMDAVQLERYGFMRRCGVFGVQTASRAGAARLLRVGSRLLGRDDTVFCITPSGSFADARERPLVLRRGLAVLLARAPDALVVPVAFEYPYWDESRPEALARLGRPITLPEALRRDPDAWQRALVAGLTATLDGLADDAQARDPARFLTLVGGRVGVGGIYDAWRRVAAFVAGRPFSAAHAGRDESAVEMTEPIAASTVVGASTAGAMGAAGAVDVASAGSAAGAGGAASAASVGGAAGAAGAASAASAASVGGAGGAAAGAASAAAPRRPDRRPLP